MVNLAVVKLKRRYWEYINVLLMLLVSGTIYFNVRITFILFFLSTTFYWYKFRKQQLLQNNASCLYFVFNLLFIFLNIFIFNTDRISNLIFNHLLFLLSSYLFITQITLERFKIIYLNLVYIISLFGIVIFLGVEYLGFPTSLLSTETKDFTVCLFNNLGINGMILHRLSSLYWEPGVFQIILVTGLILYLKEIKEFRLSKGLKFKLIVLIVALFLTYSTVAYLVFLLLSMCCFSKSRYFRKIRWLVFLLLFIIGGFIIKSDTVIGKFSSDHPSLNSRTTTNIALLLMAQEKPLIGLGVGTKQFEYYSLKYNNTSSCNGIMAHTASYGVFWLVIFLFCLFKNLKDLNLDVPILWLFIIILIMQANEPYIMYPVTNIFIFKFLK